VPMRARRGWRSPKLAAVLRDVRHFNRRSLRHAPAPVERAKIVLVVNRRRSRRFTSTAVSRLSEQLKRDLVSFDCSKLRHVTSTAENRYLRHVFSTRLPIHSSYRKKLVRELHRFNQCRLRHVPIPRSRQYARVPGMDEIKKRASRYPSALLGAIRHFDRRALKHVQLPDTPIFKAASRGASRELSPTSQMPWWPTLSTRIKGFDRSRLRRTVTQTEKTTILVSTGRVIEKSQKNQLQKEWRAIESARTTAAALKSNLASRGGMQEAPSSFS